MKKTSSVAVENNSWKDRFKKEYTELKDRYNKLHKMLVKYKAGTLDFKPNCSYELLSEQAEAMYKYLFVLETRAEIEKIEL